MGAAVAVAFVLAAALPAAATTDTAPADPDPVPGAEATLVEARSTRLQAEARLATLQADHDGMLARLQRLDAGAALITDELAAARGEVREMAVAAFIDGGQGAVLADALVGDGTEMAWRSGLLGSRAVDAAEAADRFVALQEANEPERQAVATQLDQLGDQVEQAHNDALQAAALEKDAEHALAAARARAEQEAAARAAATRAASAAAPAQVSQQRPAARKAGAASAAPSSVAGATPEEAALLARIRHCESRGNYSIVSASGRYRGAYQFDTRTWAAVGGSGDPAAASPAEQDARALQLLRQRGSRPWPNCA